MHKKRVIVICVLFVMLFFCNLFFQANLNSVEALSKYGSKGEEVKQIQTKLKRWGYYNGSIDGIYGTQTLNAVKYFQRKNGLTQDGIAGPQTLAAMGISSSSTSSRRKLFRKFNI